MAQSASTHTIQTRRVARPSRAPAAPLLLATLAGLCATLGGCNVDSYLDPSNIGRWENTSTVQPIIRRLSVIEGPEDQITQVSEISSQDLIPEVDDYRVGPGDVLDITLFDLFEGPPQTFQDQVSARGDINVPQLGTIFVAGRTEEEVRKAVEIALGQLVRDPLASVNVISRRQQLFTVVGAVSQPGRYDLERADLRVLDALAIAGWLPEATRDIFVIRQVPLTEGALSEPTGRPDRTTQPDETAPDHNLIDVIDDLTGGRRSPTVMGSSASRSFAAAETGAPQPQPEAQPDPVVELVEPGDRDRQPAQPDRPRADPEGSWVFLNGQWVRVQRESEDIARVSRAAARAGMLVTQRVIRIPVNRLIAGDASVNVVVRAGDVIHIPQPPDDNIFLSGQVARPGVFSLARGLTVTRAIAAAGGLGQLAIPDRVELVRFLPGDRQGIVMINIRAIAEGTQPDIYVKGGDHINVGTNFWAFPLAVIRGGFRATYGFGLLLDRNFGNDVFGSPPERDLF